MMQPLVSILIPVYNRDNLLGECIDSALQQSYGNVEVVVVDNCSTDNTWHVCETYAAKDNRVRVFRNETNVGPVRNWRRCMDEAKGVYGKLLFSDDVLAPDYIAECVPYLSLSQVGFVFTAAIIGTEPWKGTQKFRFAEKSGLFPRGAYLKAALFDDMVPVSPGAGLFRLADLKRGLTSAIPSKLITDFAAHGAGPDLLIYLLTTTKYEKVAYIDSALTFFRAHDQSISVKTTQNYLHHAYRQARIWFAEQHLSPSTIQAVYALEWKRHCRREQSWRLPSRVLSAYTELPASLSISEVWSVLVKRSCNWRQNVSVALKGADPKLVSPHLEPSL